MQKSIHIQYLDREHGFEAAKTLRVDGQVCGVEWNVSRRESTGRESMEAPADGCKQSGSSAVRVGGKNQPAGKREIGAGTNEVMESGVSTNHGVAWA